MLYQRICRRRAVGAILLVLAMAFGSLVLLPTGPSEPGPQALGNVGVPSSVPSHLSSHRVPTAFPPLHVRPLGINEPNTVNPNGYYTAEPAPMGIADFGVGAGGKPYEYNSTEFLGNFSWQKLNLQAGGDTQYSDQLNVVLNFVQNGVNYAYWIQDVAIMDSATNQLTFENNIWNFTTECLNNTAVSGNGTVYPFSGCEGYYAVGPTTQPGADITMPDPGDYGLLVRSYENARGIPEVAFEYWDGVTSWYVTYDNVIWPWAKHVSSDNNFLVDGYTYNPLGLFYDAEFSIGGPGNGLATEAENETHATSRLLYWNGHNFEAPPAVWNFGSDTAEAVSNIQSIFAEDRAGLPLTLQLNGTTRNATPAKAYDQNRVGELDISASGITRGTVAIPGDNWTFVNGSASLTLVPGLYRVWVNSSSQHYDLGDCQIKASATLSVSTAAGCDPVVSTPTASRGGVDLGQSVTFNATLVAPGSGGDTYTWHTSPTGLGCTASATLTLGCTPTTAGTYHVNVTVTDSAGQSGTSSTLNFTVDHDPSVPVPTANQSTVETGDFVRFTASPTGGALPYTFTWSGLPGPCTGTSSPNATCTPSTAGTYSIGVEVTDGNGFTVSSASLPYVVLNGPSVATPWATPSDAIDLGQSVNLSTTATGGTGSYTYSWSGLPAGCSSSSAPEITCEPSAAGSSTIVVSVTDSAGGRATSGSLAFQVHGALTLGSVGISPASSDVGELLLFRLGSVSGGEAPYTYVWSGLPIGCVSNDSENLTCTPTVPGSGTANVTVLDQNGRSASANATFSVLSDPSFSGVSSTRPSIDVGQTVTFTAVGVSGGTGVYTYRWVNLPSGCSSANSSSLACAPSAPGTTNTTVIISDSNGVAAEGSEGFPVFSDPSAAMPTGSPTTGEVGEDVSFSVNASGGSGSFSYAWVGLPEGCPTANRSTLTCIPKNGGVAQISVNVTDSNGVLVQSGVLQFTVLEPSGSPGASSPSAVPIGYIVLGAFGVFDAILVGLFVFVRHRRRSV